ncbi:MAG: tRNA lysidine(34) synthetase TilS [Lachnospiraceae bacterium]|nr:tRNA lysidine(34) synthetase TilS [Lachnospiraceae bacterium]
MEISYQIREQVFRYISEHRLIEQGDVVIAGISGGADSVCLLFLLLELQERLQISVKAVHVEHGIRGENALNDARFAEDLCGKHDIPLTVLHVNALQYAGEHQLSLEEAARICRYEAFEQIRAGYGTANVKIAVAHHKGDQAETVLFQLARGSGIKGLGGMQSRREHIIRPLLSCSREDILLYLKEKNIPYCMDETNADNSYARNRIRNEILPALKEIQPGCVEHIAKAAEELQEVEAYLHRQAETVCQSVIIRNADGIEIETGDFDRYDPVIRKEVIREALAAFVPGRKDILRRHIDSILSLIQKEDGKEIHLPKGVRIRKQGSRLVFGTWESDPDQRYPEGPWILYTGKETELHESAEFPIGEEKMLVSRVFAYESGAAIPQDTYTKWLDYDRIKNGFHIRTRRSGDYLCIDEQGHRKSLQDYLVNEKIPADVRDRMLLIADGDHVVWVPGYRISAYYKISEQTKKVIEIRITGGFSWETE